VIAGTFRYADSAPHCHLFNLFVIAMQGKSNLVTIVMCQHTSGIWIWADLMASDYAFAVMARHTS